MTEKQKKLDDFEKLAKNAISLMEKGDKPRLEPTHRNIEALRETLDMVQRLRQGWVRAGRPRGYVPEEQLSQDPARVRSRESMRRLREKRRRLKELEQELGLSS